MLEFVMPEDSVVAGLESADRERLLAAQTAWNALVEAEGELKAAAVNVDASVKVLEDATAAIPKISFDQALRATWDNRPLDVVEDEPVTVKILPTIVRATPDDDFAQDMVNRLRSPMAEQTIRDVDEDHHPNDR